MRTFNYSYLIIIVLLLLGINCQRSAEKKLAEFNAEFFANHVPEFPEARLMTKADIPEHSRQFFDEAGGKLQLLYDLNMNGVPEYVICGVSTTMLDRGEKAPYFVAIFENTEQGIRRYYLQKLFVPPVALTESKNTGRHGVLVLFSFYSDYSAEIYFEDGEYHLEKLF